MWKAKEETEIKKAKEKKEAMHIMNSPEDTSNIVVNLSGEDLTEEENTLLSKGLSFCPTPTKLDET